MRRSDAALGEGARRYRADPERSKAACKRYLDKNPSFKAFTNARARAKRKGLPFELDRNDIARRWALGRCEVTGIPLCDARPPGCAKAPFKGTLERVDPRKGYTAENTKLVCSIFNYAKNEWSTAVLDTFVLAYADKLREPPKQKARGGRPRAFDVKPTKIRPK